MVGKQQPRVTCKQWGTHGVISSRGKGGVTTTRRRVNRMRTEEATHFKANIEC